jgi:hypothetical protein
MIKLHGMKNINIVGRYFPKYVFLLGTLGNKEKPLNGKYGE